MNSQYLIIAGISKAGTTSLFDYLAAHPEIEASYIKQTYFFLDKELQKSLNLNSIYDYESGFKTFDRFFINNNPNVKYRVEATPDYLYAEHTPQRLAEFFKDRKGKIIFILRNPVDRFVSYFHFGKQQGLIPNDYSLKDFYQKSKEYNDNSNPCLLAYQTGFYSSYVEKYIECCGTEKVNVLFFEHLSGNPKEFMQQLAADIAIDKVFYEHFDFEVKNKTIQLRSRFWSQRYGNARDFYIRKFYKNKLGILFARLLKKSITRVYKKINFIPLESKESDIETLQNLRKDYKEEKGLLESLINTKVPWNNL